MKFNSFKYSGISRPLDRSEDDQFKGYRVIEKENDITLVKNDGLYLYYDYITSSDSDE